MPNKIIAALLLAASVLASSSAAAQNDANATTTADTADISALPVLCVVHRDAFVKNGLENHVSGNIASYLGSPQSHAWSNVTSAIMQALWNRDRRRFYDWDTMIHLEARYAQNRMNYRAGCSYFLSYHLGLADGRCIVQVDVWSQPYPPPKVKVKTIVGFAALGSAGHLTCMHEAGTDAGKKLLATGLFGKP